MKGDLPDIEVLKSLYAYDRRTGIFTCKKPRKGCRRKGAGSIDNEGYVRICIHGTRYLAHRLAWFYVYGWCPPLLDHKDRNRSNNAINNLRVANYSLNNLNSAVHSDKTNDLPKGVRYAKDRKRFGVSIQINKKRYYLGIFDNLKDAVAAYHQKAKESNYGYSKNGEAWQPYKECKPAAWRCKEAA